MVDVELFEIMPKFQMLQVKGEITFSSFKHITASSFKSGGYRAYKMADFSPVLKGSKV